VFTASLSGVSAKEEKIPDLPIVTVAENEVTLPRVRAQRARFRAEDDHSQRGMAALERLRNRPVSAGGSESRGGRLPKSHGSGSEQSRRLGQYWPLRRAGRRHGACPRCAEKALALSPNLARANSSMHECCAPTETTMAPPLACASFWRNIRATASRSTIWDAFSSCSANTRMR
jgi:hypothetical protein